MNRFEFLSTLFGSIVALFTGKPKVTASVIEPQEMVLGYSSKPVIRIWKIGSLQHKIWPTNETVQKLVNMLKTRKPTDDMDLVWTPDLECKMVEINPADIDLICQQIDDSPDKYLVLSVVKPEVEKVQVSHVTCENGNCTINS